MPGLNSFPAAGPRPASFLARPARTRFVFPDLGPAGAAAAQIQATQIQAPAACPPELSFDEAALARAMAAGAAMARIAAKAEQAAALDEALRRAAARLTEEAEALADARRDAGRAAQALALALVMEFAQACLEQLAGPAAAQAMLRAVQPALAGLDAGTEVTLAVAPDLVEPLARLLAGDAPGSELAATSRLGRIVVQARPDLVPGDICLSWPDGWAEWSLDRLRRALAESLAAHAPDPPGLPEPSGAAAPAPEPALAGPVAGEPTPPASDDLPQAPDHLPQE
ncbi:FliH/SctL family protein [Geminicoccus roseus]|uniref:hypothetical protein n=1 Tax=Geminicoccus roseus TaxID=404900 RepID=UPI000420BCA8|nr:hypothetical protein [Geminicoccus roseus]